MSDHQLSKLTNTMVTPPLIPGTDRYSTLHDKDRVPQTSTMQDNYNEDVLAVDQQEPPGFKPLSHLEKDPGLVPFEMDRDELTTEFYNKLQQLKSEHQKTLEMLELLYTKADERCQQAKDQSQLRDSGQVSSNGSKKENVFLTEDDKDVTMIRRRNLTNGNVEDDSDASLDSVEDSDDAAERVTQNVRFRDTVDSRDYENRESERYNRVEEMWDDFNLRDYLPLTSIERAEKRKEKAKSRPQSAPVKKEWSPVITIPKPFKMTLREENKKEKSHTRSSEEVARAIRQRLEEEELELQTRVRARDPPAHTFLPLYEEITERQEQRSRMNRENASRALQAMVKPFSFMERERMKEKDKEKIKHLQGKKERRKLKSMVQFVANPIPTCVYDANISERMKEEQLYRKIKVKMRSEDLMRESSLPPRMHSHELMYAQRRKRRNKDIRRATKLSFRPRTHDMPDFESLHRRHQLEQSARKMELETTITEPFQLRTTEIRKKKMAMQEAAGVIQQEDDDFRKSMDALKSRKYVPTLDSIPTRMTEAARLRLDETRRALAKAEEELLQLKLKDRERKERRKKMAREVSARFTSTDGNPAQSEEYRKERLRHYQQQQKARNQEYQRELKDMNDRLKKRPLLFEQQAQNSARLHAEKRYKEILRNSGLSDDFGSELDTRENGDYSRSLQDDYSDDEFETSIIRSGPKESSGQGDTDSEVEEDIQSEEEERSRTSVKKHIDFDV